MAKEAIMAILHSAEDVYPNELKAEIMAAIGKIDHIELFGQEVLVAPYVQSPRTKGGIITTASSQEMDDKWMSKSFLVLKLGPDALTQSDKRKMFIQPGEWCWGIPEEHTHISVRGLGAKAKPKNSDGTPYRKWGDGGWPCRLILVGDIRGRTTRPQDIM